MAYNKAEYIEKQKEMQKQLSEQVKNIAKSYSEDPKIYEEMLEFGSRFYQYSQRNNALIYSQNPFATYTDSFMGFKKLGYNVKKGEHGLKIFVPFTVTLIKDNNDQWITLSEADKTLKAKYNKGEAEVRTVQRYKVGTVFDISQTDCPVEDYPKIFNMGINNTSQKEIFEAVKNYAEKELYCPVELKDLKSISLKGQYFPIENLIQINELLKDNERLSTAFHELSHAILHHDINEKPGAQKEFEADSLSIMLEKYFGIEILPSRQRHLADHFNRYNELLKQQSERKSKNGSELQNIDEVLSNVSEHYVKILPEIEKYLKPAVQEDTFKEKTFAQQVDEALKGKTDRYSDLKVCDTPQILLDVGCKQLPMLYSQKHLREALKPKNNHTHAHGLTIEQIKKIPTLISEPVMIFDSLTKSDSIVIVTSEIDNNNNPIITSVRPNGKGRYELENIDSNFVTSIYGRENFEKHINRVIITNNLLYCNKEKSQELFSVLGLQSSKGLNNLDSNIIIHKSQNIVNENQAEVKEKIHPKEMKAIPHLNNPAGIPSNAIDILGLYRRDNGDEFIHFAINNNGKHVEYLTNGSNTWSDNCIEDRLSVLKSVDSIDTQQMEYLLKTALPSDLNYPAAQVLEVVKQNQQQPMQKQQIKPMSK